MFKKWKYGCTCRRYLLVLCTQCKPHAWRMLQHLVLLCFLVIASWHLSIWHPTDAPTHTHAYAHMQTHAHKHFKVFKYMISTPKNLPHLYFFEATTLCFIVFHLSLWHKHTQQFFQAMIGAGAHTILLCKVDLFGNWYGAIWRRKDLCVGGEKQSVLSCRSFYGQTNRTIPTFRGKRPTDELCAGVVHV